PAAAALARLLRCHLADLETQILHCHYVEKWCVATGHHDTVALERSHRFPVIQPNSGHRDYSRSSCDGGRCSSASRGPGSGAGAGTAAPSLAASRVASEKAG